MPRNDRRQTRGLWVLHPNPTGNLNHHETPADDRSKRQPPDLTQGLPGVGVVPHQCDDAEQRRRRAKHDPPVQRCFHTRNSNTLAPQLVFSPDCGCGAGPRPAPASQAGSAFSTLPSSSTVRRRQTTIVCTTPDTGTVQLIRGNCTRFSFADRSREANGRRAYGSATYKTKPPPCNRTPNPAAR